MKDFKKVLNEFKKIKNELKDVDTSDKTSGIYMLYIDDLSLDNLIPVYIGQSVNLYNRRTSHRGKTKKLFMLSTEDYNKQIPLNAGKYLYCKLVSTLRNNNKTLEDVKFKVLEHCEKEKLNARENYWINYFEAPVYGFNQFEEIIMSNKITAELLFAKETLDYNKIANEGITVLQSFEKKIQNFDDSLLKYRYYSVNYTLLLGNYNSLYKTLYKMSTEHFMEIDDNVSSKLSSVLEQTDINIKIATTMFMQTEYLKWGTTLFKEFEIK